MCEQRAPFVDAAVTASEVTFMLSRITSLISTSAGEVTLRVGGTDRNARGDDLERAPKARPSRHLATDDKKDWQVPRSVGVDVL